jgi:hypothetical protein
MGGKATPSPKGKFVAACRGLSEKPSFCLKLAFYIHRNWLMSTLTGLTLTVLLYFHTIKQPKKGIMLSYSFGIVMI